MLDLNYVLGYEKKDNKKDKQNKDWVKETIKHPGAFHEWCVEHGYDKVTPECIEEGLKDPDPVVRKRAALAKALLKMQQKRKKKNNGSNSSK